MLKCIISMTPGQERSYMEPWNIYQNRPYAGWSRSRRKAGITQSVFSNHSAIKQGMNNRRITTGSPSIWKLSNTLLNKPRGQKRNHNGY